MGDTVARLAISIAFSVYTRNPKFGLVTMDLGGVQIADEGQDLAAEKLPGNEHPESRRVGRDERRGHHVDTGVELFVDLFAGQVFAGVVGLSS